MTIGALRPAAQVGRRVTPCRRPLRAPGQFNLPWLGERAERTRRTRPRRTMSREPGTGKGSQPTAGRRVRKTRGGSHQPNGLGGEAEGQWDARDIQVMDSSSNEPYHQVKAPTRGPRMGATHQTRNETKGASPCLIAMRRENRPRVSLQDAEGDFLQLIYRFLHFQ